MQDLLAFVTDKAYRTSANVYDLAMQKAEDLTHAAIEKPRTLWGRIRNYIYRFFSLGSEGFLASIIEALFRTLGFGALSLGTKMVGFFMIFVVPLVLVLMMYLFPSALDEKGAGRPAPRMAPEGVVGSGESVMMSSEGESVIIRESEAYYRPGASGSGVYKEKDS